MTYSPSFVPEYEIVGSFSFVVLVFTFNSEDELILVNSIFSVDWLIDRENVTVHVSPILIRYSVTQTRPSR